MWHILALVLLGVLIGGAFALLSPQGRELIDRAWINYARQEHLARTQSGLPLKGSPNYAELEQRLGAMGLESGAPVFMRIFKLEFELELWMQKDGRYVHFATYPVCRWSGRLGPKLKEGDLQAPEGFYTVDKSQLNPDSRWHRSFNLGFPNTFDRAHGRTGSFLMVHGGCGSIGCYAMTDAGVDEIWRLVTAALDKEQQRFQVQVFPFRMTERNLAMRRGQEWSAFWEELKPGYDLFEETRVPPVVSVCKGAYAFEAGRAGEAAQPIETRCPETVAGAL
jgi:murein L,D-transpeptidase YafK